MDFTLTEIRNQTNSWAQTLAEVEKQWQAIEPQISVRPETQFLFIGCGTSFYLAQSAARLVQHVTGNVCTPVPASEIFLADLSTVPAQVPVLAFIISRSGTTSEALRAMKYLHEKYSNVTTVGITCHSEKTLAAEAKFAISLNHAAEESVVMTQSFTNMLLAIQWIGARIAERQDLIDELHQLPALLKEFLRESEEFGHMMATDEKFHQYIYLGLGAYFGLASEATLKLKEMTQVPCEFYNPLEFRHGPISIVEGHTAVVIVSGETELGFIVDLVQDIQNLGGTVTVLQPESRVQGERHLTLPGKLSDWSRTVLYMPALQLLAHDKAVSLGLNPDQPRNLSQVVILPE